MGYTAFQAEEYDAKIRQTLPFYDAFYEQIADILEAAGKKHISWLDIGYGTGKMYEVVEKRIPVLPGGRRFRKTGISDFEICIFGNLRRK